MDPHRLAELRSIALHRAVCDLIRGDPTVIESARARVERWRAAGTLHADYARLWMEALSLPLDDLCALLVADTERARAMRQCTPFAGTIAPRERWRIWRDTRLAHEAGT